MRSTTATTPCTSCIDLLQVLLQSLPVKDSVELLQLALNSSCHAVATCVAEELLPHVTDPAVLLHLVHTAVMRHHREAVQSAVDHPAAHQLKPAEVLQLMQVAADQATPAVLWYPDGFTPTSYMHMLTKLPAARGLSLVQLTPLLHTKCGATIAALSTLPAADLTVAADLNSMLQLAVAEGFDSAICALCSLSAAASLTSDDLVPLMVLAAATSSGRLLNAGVKALCRLLPIQAQHEMFRDLPVAAAQDSDKVVSDLCKLPAVRSMSSVAWVRMLIQLLPGQRRVSDTKLEALCQLPAARTASTEAIAAVLKAAVGSMRSVAVMVLCELPPAEHMTASQISAIAQEAKVHQRSQLYWAIIKLSQTRGEPICGAFDTFRALATLKGVNCLSIDQLVDIAGMLMQLECSKCSPAWYTCPAAQKMPASTLFQLMQRAVQLQDAVQLHALCQLPAAKVVDAECVQQLLISTVGRDNDTSRLMQQYLWLLPGATKITGEHLADVLSAIVGANNTLQHHFLDLPAAPLVAVDSVAGLLQNAVKHRNLSTVQKLCKLPQAHHLSHTAVAKVMLALVDCDDADKYVVAIADVVRLQVAHPAADVCNTRLEVGDAIQAAVRKGDTGLLHTYCQMSAAKVIKSNVLIQCMMEAVRLNSTAAIHKLTRLPSAAELHGEAVHGLLRTAVQMGSINVIYCLIGLPGAQQIPAEARRDLVKSAQQQGSTWAVSTLQLFLSNTC